MFNGLQEPERPTTHHGDVAAGFWGDCLPFTITATLTVAITTLDIITDWIMYRAFMGMAFAERVQAAVKVPWYNETQNVIWLYREVYVQIPLLLQIFCIVGLVVYVFYFLWMCWMFTTERKKFKDKRDGVPHKGTFVENYGGDFFILLHICLHDLPVAAILFAVQVAISCRFLILVNHVIYFIATVVTLVSLVWNILQVFYNGGCLGLREEFLSTKLTWVLRSVSVVMAMMAITVASLNVILLTGWQTQIVKGSFLGSEVINKVAVDQWMEEGKIIFWVNTSSELPLSYTNSSSYNLIEVVTLKRVFASGEHGLSVELPCEGDMYSLLPFLQQTHTYNADIFNCTAIFRFLASRQEPVINFDYLYMFYNEDRYCVYSHFKNGGIMTSMPSIRDEARPPEHLIDSRGEKVLLPSNVQPPQVLQATLPHTTVTEVPDDHTGSPPLSTDPSPVEGHAIWISDTSHLGCNFRLVHNSVMFPGSPCQS